VSNTDEVGIMIGRDNCDSEVEVQLSNRGEFGRGVLGVFPKKWSQVIQSYTPDPKPNNANRVAVCV